MNDIAPAAKAPAMTELHWMMRRTSAATPPPSMISSRMRVSIVIAVLSAQAEERQDRHDHHDQADEINQSVHDTSSSFLLVPNHEEQGRFQISPTCGNEPVRCELSVQLRGTTFVSTKAPAGWSRSWGLSAWALLVLC